MNEDSLEPLAELVHAAELGDADAQFDLALRYQTGEGAAVDLREAARWYGTTAAQGLAAAQNNLGVVLATGRGLPRDREAARSWFERAAAQRHNGARYNLGLLHAAGDGSADLAIAYAWLALAARHGHPEAAARRDAVLARMSAAERCLSRRLAAVVERDPLV